jgi:hypothetical protein
VSHASYTYIKVLEGFFTCSHELLLLMQVARVGHPLKDVYSCWQEFGGIQWRSVCSNDVVVFGLNVLDLGSPSPCKEDAGSRLRKDMQQILPVTVRQLQGVSAAKVRVTCEPNYGACCGEIDSQWGCFSLHIALKPPFNVPFQWHQANALSAKFPWCRIFYTLLSECTFPRGNLKYRCHSHQIRTYLNFIMLVVCNPDVSKEFLIWKIFITK